MNFSWYTGFLGGYLVPKLNPDAFQSSPKTFELVPLNAPVVHAVKADCEGRRLSVDITWRPSAARRSAIQAYWNDLVVPVWKQLAGREDINRAMKPYRALRIIGVFAQMDRDSVISRITDTEAGKVGKEFYLRLAAVGALPALTVVSAYFPPIGRFLAGLTQPALDALH